MEEAAAEVEPAEEVELELCATTGPARRRNAAAAAHDARCRGYMAGGRKGRWWAGGKERREPIGGVYQRRRDIDQPDQGLPQPHSKTHPRPTSRNGSQPPGQPRGRGPRRSSRIFSTAQLSCTTHTEHHVLIHHFDSTQLSSIHRPQHILLLSPSHGPRALHLQMRQVGLFLRDRRRNRYRTQFFIPRCAATRPATAYGHAPRALLSVFIGPRPQEPRHLTSCRPTRRWSQSAPPARV